MCNEACALSPVHRPECQMTVARGSPINIEVNPLKPFPLYEAVCIMRCLAFKNTDPAKYKALMALEPHTEARRATGRSATQYVDVLKTTHFVPKLINVWPEAETIPSKKLDSECSKIHTGPKMVC